MIDPQEVITMRVPFPTISSGLAVSPHMYICLEKENQNKRFLKCQTLKPKHLGRNKAPFRRVEENPDILRNPFNNKTLIDCDKKFLIERVEISRDLLTKNRINVCGNLFNLVRIESNHPAIVEHLIETTSLIQINSKIKVKS